MTESDCIKELQALTGNERIIFTKRGNESILLSLKYAKSIGKTKVFIQDQGGWITYLQYPKKAGLEMIKVKTDYGLVREIDIDDKSVVLINSMPGYAYPQEMEWIADKCNKVGALLINDVSGSIGRENAKVGDIIIGSFGKWKPVDLEHGGFIATDESIYNRILQPKDPPVDFSNLLKKLKILPKRLDLFSRTNKKIKKDLDSYDIIHKELDGINVIVKFPKNDIIDYCERNKYEYTVCPRYIRVNDDAISIEVKRLISW